MGRTLEGLIVIALQSPVGRVVVLVSKKAGEGMKLLCGAYMKNQRSAIDSYPNDET